MYRTYKTLSAMGCGASTARTTHSQSNSSLGKYDVLPAITTETKQPPDSVHQPTSTPQAPPLPSIASGVNKSNNEETVPKKEVKDAIASPQNENSQLSKTEAELRKEKERRELQALKEKADGMLKLLTETQTMLEKRLGGDNSSENEISRRALEGDIEMECPSPAKIVRIFTSSTFTDTMHERNILMKQAYPKVKAHCRKIGYEFQVVDMRWGVRDEATDDHMGTELCLKELKLCQKLSTGPNFVSLLSHKYGYTAFPRVIEAEDFEAIVGNIERRDIKDLFHKWYQKDENMVPASYILSSISTNLPDFISNDKDKKKIAREQWWTESEAMQEAMGISASKLFSEEKARKFIMSVTETEVREGLVDINDQDKHCLWLKRDIDDIENQEPNYQLSRYIECTGSTEKWTRARKMLKELKEKEMEKKLPKDKILTYHVNWSDSGGINPDEDGKHKTYLQRMCDDFVTSMCNMIDQSVSQRRSADEPLVQELLQHISFCQIKYELFHGREDSLEVIRQYICGSSTQPFVLYGESGSGKTSLMAKAAKMTKQWLQGKQVKTVIRFLGTSPDSSSIIPLLQNLTKQIRRNYSPLRREISDGLDLLIKEFSRALAMSRPEKPMVLFLDSIDQLDSSFEGRLMGWLTAKLPPNTKVIISTLPDTQYECFPAMKAKDLSEDSFYKVPKLNDEEASEIIEKWLAIKKRRLTENQRNIVLKAFKQCPTPLYLKMIFDEASTWTSFAPQEATCLPDTVQKCIEKLFDKLEKMHGKILVSKALAYLTLAKNGLSESELEDILSCDDDVLNDVYVYWTPPIRRLPPLLLVRLRTDLSSYLVERGADGSRVTYWYHRQFIEAARARYCNQMEMNQQVHMALADFFAGIWSRGRKKPYTSNKGEKGEEDRHIAEQPLTFGESTYNLRALNNLPFHRLHAQQLDLIKKECLANYEFLLHKVCAVPLVHVIEDFKNTIKEFPEDEILTVILQALNLSQKAMMHDPTQLAAQMIGRLKPDEVTKGFLQQCLDYPRPYLQSTRDVLSKPGGQLVSCLAGHKSELDCIDMTADGRLVVTASQSDLEVMVWDIEKHVLKKTIQGLGQCTATFFCLNDKCIATEMEQAVRILVVETGSKRFDVPMPQRNKNCIAVTGDNKDILVVFNRKSAYVHDLNKQGQLIEKITIPDMNFGGTSIASSTKDLVAVTDDNQYFIVVLDVKSRTFYPKFRGFEKIYDPEIEDYEEHEVEEMCFTPDQSMLVYTNMFTSEVVFADVKTGERKRYIEGDKDNSFRGLKITADGKYMYIRESDLLKIFDVETLQEVDQLKHPKDVQFAVSRDMKIVVTVAEDCNVRIWDRSRPKMNEANQRDGRKIDLYYIQQQPTIEMSRAPNPRFVVGIGEKRKNDEDSILFVADILRDNVVREHKIPGKGFKEVQVLLTPDPKVALITSGYHGFVVDVDSGKILHKLNSALPKYSKNAVTVTKRNEIVTMTKGLKFLKIYDLATGNVVSILKGDQTQKIDSIQVNDAGTMATAQTDEGPLLIFDLENRKYLYSISNKHYDDFFATISLVNDRKSHVLFSTDKPIPGLPEKEDVTQAVVWDVVNRKELCMLNDKVSQQKLQHIKSDDSTSMDEMFFLDDTKIISHHYDYVIRVFDYMQGTLLHRLTGHTTQVKLSVPLSGPYIFSYGSFSEEDCFKIWDKKSFKCVASYTLDETVSSVAMSSDGKFIISRTHQPADLFRWDIIHGPPEVQYKVDDYEEDFKEGEKGNRLELPIPEVYQPDPNDPDSDPEIPSDDEDIDDDDD